MISLYPSHIHISFSYSHILPYPYISHIHVLIFLSVLPVALPPVFSHFSFFVSWAEQDVVVCFSCGFLMLVLWMFFGLPFVPFFGPFPPFRLSSRLSFRLSARFPVSLFAPPFGLPRRFVFPFGRVGWAVRGACRFCQLIWGGLVFIYLSCRDAVAAMWGACIVDGGGGSADGGVWALVRSVWRGVGRVACRGVGRGVVAFAGLWEW